MSDVVTRLIVRADGSIPILDQFERGMREAGAATDRATGAVASYEARMAAARKAIEAGNAVSTQVVARKSAEQRAYDNLAASVDRTAALRIRQERAAERAAVSAANAVTMGYISNEQALTTLTALEERHAAELARVTAMNDTVAGSYHRTAGAADSAAQSVMRYNSANGRVSAGHTTNLMFQAQDIAMMTAMGQAPGMLAMQQGLQVGGIFSQMGSGRQVVQGLTGALAMMLNPINLATIGFIGLGSAAVQALMNMGDNADEASSALEQHSAWLDTILMGYQAARDAASDAVDEALRLPQGSVESNLATQQESSIAAEMAAFDRLIAKQAELQERLDTLRLGGSLFEDIISTSQAMTEMSFTVDMTNAQLGEYHAALTRIANSNVDAETRQWAQALLTYIDQARAARAETESLGAALNNLPTNINIDLAVRGLGVSDAIARITNMTPELRDAREIINDIFTQEAGQARTTSELQALADAAEGAIAALDEQDRRAEALKAEREAGKSATSSLDQWGAANDNFQQRIDQMQLEIELFGQSTYEVTRQQAAFDLLNQAKEAGIPITDTVTGQINAMSAEYAELTVEMERMQQQAQLAVSINNTLASGFTSMFMGIIDGSKSAGEAIGDLLSSLGQLLINQAFMSLFGAGTSGGIGGFLSGLFMPNALGNVYSSPGLSAYSSQVVSSPTLFPFANGIGLMGEAGPEAIMPLQRGPDGRLGVSAHANQNQAQGNGAAPQITMHNTIVAPPGATEADGAAFARSFAKELKKQLPDAMQAVNKNPYRRAG